MFFQFSEKSNFLILEPADTNDENMSNLKSFVDTMDDTASIRKSRLSSSWNPEIQRLVDQISAMYMDNTCNDVTLIVEGTHFPAHKAILAARSVYFK